MASLLLVGGAGIGTSPAWLHNYFVAHDPVLLSAHSGVNLWIGNNPDANGYPRFPLGLRAAQRAMLQDSITGAEAAAGRPLKRSEVSAYWSDKAKSYLRENPGAALQLMCRKLLNFWNSFQYDDLSIITSLREQGVVFPGLRFGIVAALAIAGIVLAVPSFIASRWVLAAVLLHMLSLLSVFITERYRLAAVPGLLLFAGFTVTQLWRACATGTLMRAAAVTALLAMSSWFVSVRRGNPELWALDAYNSGVQALADNDLAAAEKRLTLAQAYVPNNAEVNFALGNLEMARGNRSAAQASYMRTLSLNPQHKGVFNNLGVLALEEQRWDIALEVLRKALEQEPDNAKTHYLLAKALLGAGDVNGARSAVARALALDPHRREFLELEAEILTR
jgi:Flp pilus assembly protein TadD